MGKYKRIIKEVPNQVPNNWAIGLQEGRDHSLPRASRKVGVLEEAGVGMPGSGRPLLPVDSRDPDSLSPA